MLNYLKLQQKIPADRAVTMCNWRSNVKVCDAQKSIVLWKLQMLQPTTTNNAAVSSHRFWKLSNLFGGNNYVK